MSLAHARAHSQERRDYSRTYSKDHRGERNVYQRRRRADGHLALTETQRERRRAQERERDRRMTPEQREAYRLRWAGYYSERAKRERATNAAYRERVAEAGRRYLAAHPDVLQERAARRRAQKLALPNEIVTMADLIERDGSCCYLCGRTLTRRQMTFEHVIPLSRGGHHVKANLKIACRSCNCSKGPRLLSEIGKAA